MFRDITEDEFAMKIAEELGKRVAEIVVKLSK
jgi:hypothetical protein